MLCTPCLKNILKMNGYELIECEQFVSRTGAVSRTGPRLYKANFLHSHRSTRRSRAPRCSTCSFLHSDLSALLRVYHTLSINYWVEQIGPKLIAQRHIIC